MVGLLAWTSIVSLFVNLLVYLLCHDLYLTDFFLDQGSSILSWYRKLQISIDSYHLPCVGTAILACCPEINCQLLLILFILCRENKEQVL